ncbi:oligosaccharide flippase family protein [Desulfosediminicola flagellatus]|uniref:oligosaccharide flippase family protein n=1 Tax=Desulfosediminicola flagellatus TaxID=2569541 RepID=UPI0010AB6653|nr:oligosaccharide flippase family protein [Desulfosediminicola flagellatus]
MQPNAKDVLKAGAIVSVSSIVGRALAFLSGVVIAPAIGPAGYGLFVLCRDLCLTGSMFCRSGFPIGIIRKIRESKGNSLLQSSYIVHAFYISGTISLLLMLFAWVWGGNYLATNVFPDERFSSTFRVMVLLVPLLTFLDLLNACYRAYFKVQKSSIVINIGQPSTRLLLIVCLFIFSMDLRVVIWGTLLSYLLAVGYLLYDSRNWLLNNLFSPKHLPKINIRNFWSYSFVIAITGSVNLLMDKMDGFMIGYFNGSEEVGNYAIIKIAVPVIILFNGAFNSLLGTTIAALAADNDYGGMANAMQQHSRWMVISSFPLFLVFAVWGKDLLLIFGKAFTLPTATIILLAGGQLIVALFSSVGFALSMTKNYQAELPVSLLGLFINACLNYILIPEYGIIGAAIATVIAILTVNIVRLTIVCKLYHFFPFDRWVVPPMLLAFVSVLTTWYLRNWIGDSTITGAIIASCFFSILYLLLLYFFGLNPADNELSKTIIRKMKTKIAL